jgi:hypothetical protein
VPGGVVDDRRASGLATASSPTDRAARAWAFRWGVEIAAERAFARLAIELRALGFPVELADLCDEVSRDERRHAGLCAGLARGFGADAPIDVDEPPSLAPPSLPRDRAATYDLIARCCIAETESTATLLRLSRGDAGAVHEAVHEIARDEVKHARLGWATLAWLSSSGRDVGFLGDWLPAMMAPGGGPLFERDADDGDGPDLVDLGVLGVASKRAIFVETLEQVILPGFELHRVPTGAARAWLAAKQAALAGIAADR